MPLLEEKYKKDVDEAIMMELENMRQLAGGKVKKKKKGKKKKGKKKGKAKKIKLPGYKMIATTPIEELLTFLIQ